MEKIDSLTVKMPLAQETRYHANAASRYLKR